MTNLPAASQTSLPALRAHRLRSVSRWMAYACLLASVLCVVALAIYWLVTPQHDLLTAAQISFPSLREVTFGTRIAAFAISMVPLAVLIWGLLNARRCFVLFSRGCIFTAEAVDGFRRFSLALLISALFKPFAGAALTALLSWGGPPGTRMVAIHLGSDTLFSLLFAGAMMVVVWVMSEAIAIADENAQFI